MDHDSWEILEAALECKVPARMPSVCIAVDYEFMERLNHSPLAFTYEEFKEMKKRGIAWIPFFLGASIKLGVTMSWNTNPATKIIWLDEFSELAMLTGGRFRMTTHVSSYKPPAGVPKRPIPHYWHFAECFSSTTPKERIAQYIEKQPKIGSAAYKKFGKLRHNCEKYYNLVLAGAVNGTWEPLVLGFGISLVSKLWRKDREFLHQIRDYIHELEMKAMDNLIKHGRPRVIMLGDDYGFNSGLQMSMEMWRDLMKPTLVECANVAHDAGIKFILHSCGKIEDIFKDLVEIHVDGVQSLSPLNNDLIGLKQKYGDKIALLGGIDDSNILKYATPAEIKNYVTKAIHDLGPAGFVPGPTNALLDLPVENVIAMFDAIKEYKT